MNIKRFFFLLVVPVILLMLTTGLIWAKADSALVPGSQAPLGTGFTYQGRLTNDGQVADGIFDFQFGLYDAETAGTLIGLLVLDDVHVVSGVFTVELDFGSGSFDGQERWLEIGVRPGEETSAFDPLVPRQPLTAVPYAQYAVEAGRIAWENLSDNPIPGSCARGEIMIWDDALKVWDCAEDQNTTYDAGFGLHLEDSTFHILTTTIQARVMGECPWGSTVRLINGDGTVICQADAPLNRGMAPKGTVTNTLSGAGTEPSLTIGVDGLPIISTHSFSAGDLRVVHCNDLSCNSFGVSIVDSGDVGYGSSIAIGPDGLPLISYLDVVDYDLKVAHCDDLACTSATLNLIADIGGIGCCERTSLVIGSDGLPVISYFNISDAYLLVAHCDDLACASASTAVIDTGIDPFSASMAIGVDGLPVISYSELLGADGARVAHCQDLACANVVINPIGNGGETAITIGIDGLPVIAYHSYDDWHLKVIHCDDLACSSYTMASYGDMGNGFGGKISITVGVDGLPIISYFDGDTKLVVTHCGDLLCSIGNTVNFPALSGWNSSITIGVDGLPLISNPAVTHCSNPFCVPYFRRR